jgi:hypothetical protein
MPALWWPSTEQRAVLTDADLGGQIIRQRTLRQGRAGEGFRLLTGFGSHRSVFLFGFAKNER